MAASKCWVMDLLARRFVPVINGVNGVWFKCIVPEMAIAVVYGFQSQSEIGLWWQPD